MMTKACKKRRAVFVSSELGSLSTILEVDESRLSKEDVVTPIPTCEHQLSCEVKAESMNTSKIRRCTKILRELMHHKFGWIFNQPVDPELYGLPDYFDVIRNPMDLGTVKQKLSNKQYVSTDEFAADVRLTFSNAVKYNPPGNDIHAIAQQLNGIFDSKWESVKKKFRGPSPVKVQKTVFTKACKKGAACVSSELGDSSTVFGAEESRLSEKDGVTPIPIGLCRNIVRKLIDYKGGWLFKNPVDPVLLGIPDYFDVIHNPMDLGTVKNKLTKNNYGSIEEFAADVRLTFSNAMKYNPPGNDVHTLAKELNRVFDLLWESVKKKFRGPSPVQEQKTIFTEDNFIAKKPLTDALSFKVKIISFVGSDEQISSEGVNDVSSPVQEQKTIFTEDNFIAKKPLTDTLSFKVKIISFVGSDEQISSEGVNDETRRMRFLPRWTTRRGPEVSGPAFSLARSEGRRQQPRDQVKHPAMSASERFVVQK